MLRLGLSDLGKQLSHSRDQYRFTNVRCARNRVDTDQRVSLCKIPGWVAFSANPMQLSDRSLLLDHRHLLALDILLEFHLPTQQFIHLIAEYCLHHHRVELASLRPVQADCEFVLTHGINEHDEWLKLAKLRERLSAFHYSLAVSWSEPISYHYLVWIKNQNLAHCVSLLRIRTRMGRPLLTSPLGSWVRLGFEESDDSVLLSGRANLRCVHLVVDHDHQLLTHQPVSVERLLDALLVPVRQIVEVAGTKQLIELPRARTTR